MSRSSEQQNTINSYLRNILVIGEPDSSGALTIYPVFGGEPGLDYISMSRAHGQGLSVKELPGDASVRDLIVFNPLSVPVLLFEGEEVLGAQQNRTLDKSVLVPAGESIRIPVSCVEAGRWDGSRHGEGFRPSSQTAHPELRREKSSQSARARTANQEERANQNEVWSSVDSRAHLMQVSSSTGSMHDVYEARREDLHQMAGDIQLHEGQIGAIFQIENEVKGIDMVSRPEVFADLHQPLVQGYCLDALAAGRRADSKPDRQSADLTLGSGFLETALGARVSEKDGIGLGRDFRFDSSGLVGAGLVSGEELIQVSVFAGETEGGAGPDSGSEPVSTRISRPSRRGR